ncbi:hypothetical protein BGZ80_009437 [Entomortierella chlamydospora]|uniref:Arm-like repeat domain-containing protein n=1 Tax=Entomortierella chlamydospora TaxID=101097 RepID=A0A9P6MWV3_9FUNG|nr:hypothetical protein BGZ80_009437 [Entomortierella chlamydospora]
MIRKFFSSPSSGLPLEDVFELANQHLDKARDASTPTEALHLCGNAKSAIKDAENILNKRAKGQTLNNDIANAYQRHGELLEKLGQQTKAEKSYTKAKKWGYVHFATLQIESTTVVLGTPDDNNPTPHRQSHTDDAISARIENQPVANKDIAQVQQIIFARDISPTIARFALPEPGGRIASTSQLAYCLNLLHHSLDSNEGLDKAESDWSQATEEDPGEKERLQTMTTDVIRAFVRDELKGSDAVAETVELATVLEQDDFRKLLEVFVDGIGQSVLLKVHLLDGLACLMKNAPQGSLDPDDLIRILELLNTQLKGAHKQSTQHIYLLSMTISRVLDSMVDSQVKGLSREQLHEPLSQYLQGLQKSSDPRLVYQAAYAYQSLQHVPDDEKFLKAMMRRTGKVVRGISGLVSAVKAIDLNRFVDGLQHIQEGVLDLKDTITLVTGAYKDVKSLVESGQGFLESLKEGLSFSRKSAWYPALRGLDSLIQEGRLIGFEKLIRSAPCRQDPAFQWGVCQRLGEIASNTAWDTETREIAITFLGEMYMDDSQWGQQVHVKQWILRILSTLANSTEGEVASSAKKQLQELEVAGDSSKNSFTRSNIGYGEDSHTLTLALPSLLESRLLDIVQNKADIETPLRQLKHERLKEGVRNVYISPRAKHRANATDSFDLTSKVQEFLSDHKKVFLLLGDSGSGKSTFNRSLEMDLWNKYGKGEERIPLYVHLPSIKEPEHGLIDKCLRDLSFTESQIRELKLYREFILICDGIIQEAVLVPFDKNQIRDYIDQYVSYGKSPWKTDDYLQALKKIPNLQDLVTNPFLLKIAVEVLPELVGTRNDFSQIRITRVQLYEGFIAQWIERAKVRLGEMELSSRDKEAFKILLGSGFSELGVVYLKELATAIYDNQGGIPAVKYSDHHDQRSWKKEFFGNSDGKNLLREAIPLIHSSNQYRFIHRSILEYGLSLAVFDPQQHQEDMESKSTSSRRGSVDSILSFEEKAPIGDATISIEQKLLASPFGRMSIVDGSSVSQFLVDQIQRYPVFKQQLLAVLERSKTEKAVRVAAANAITVLVRAGVLFNGADLRGIKVPGADLSYGMFDSAQLDGADLRKANLYNIWLHKATLCGAQMTGVKFGELPLLQQPKIVDRCAYSEDGKMLAVGLGGGDISLYDSSSWEKIRTLTGHDGDIKCLVFSDTSEQIASGSKDGEVRVWDVKTGECSHTTQCPGEVLAMAEHLPGRYRVASQGEYSTVKMWDVESANCFQTLKGHDNDVLTAAFSPNGDQVASGGRDKSVRLWNVDTGDCVHVLEGHSDIVFCMVYSPDGGKIASGCIDRTIKLWNVASGHCIYTLSGHDNIIHSLTYSPRGDQIASGSLDQTVRLWDVGTSDCIQTLKGHAGTIPTVVYLSGGDQVASGSWDSTVRLWKTKTGNFTRDQQGHAGNVYAVADSPRGGQVASASSDSTIRLWDVETGDCLRTFQGHEYAIFNIEYSPMGDRIASGSADNSVRLWNIETGDCVHALMDHELPVMTITYSPNGDQIASGSEDKTVRLWDVETGNCVHVLNGHDDFISSVVFSPKGGQVASGSEDKTVRLWDVKTGNCVTTLEGHGMGVTRAVYSPNGGQIASGSSDKTIRLWDVESGKCVHTLEGHDGGIIKVVYSPQGDQIASGSGDKTVRLWNVVTGSCVHTLDGHTSPILSLVYSPKGDKIASGGRDNTLRLWDVKTGQFLVAITGFSGPVGGITWQETSEGLYLITDSWDKSVRRWQITKKQDEYEARLCWSSSNDGLVVAEASFNDVQRLNQENLALLKQRGALIPSPPVSE